MANKLQLSVECSDDMTTWPRVAEVTLTEPLIALVERMQKIVADADLYSATKFEYSPRWLSPEDGSVECVELVVTDKDFYWQALLISSSIVITTDHIMIDELPN